jgi:hypothetical protein
VSPCHRRRSNPKATTVDPNYDKRFSLKNVFYITSLLCIKVKNKYSTNYYSQPLNPLKSSILSFKINQVLIFWITFFSRFWKTTVLTIKSQNIGLNEQIDVHNSYIVVWKRILKMVGNELFSSKNQRLLNFHGLLQFFLSKIGHGFVFRAPECVNKICKNFSEFSLLIIVKLVVKFSSCKKCAEVWQKCETFVL